MHKEYGDVKFVNKIKAQGIEFNNYGIDRNNIKTVKVKIENGLKMWDNISLNMIERITVVKTFCLGRLAFVASFMYVKEDDIIEIERLFFKFIWNGVIEKIKRNTLILPYEQGGLNMISVKAKIETILFQQFKYFVENRNRSFYQLSVYWLKFCMRGANLNLFNLIPMGADKDRPKFYNEIIKSVVRVKKLDDNMWINITNLNSKITYSMLVRKYLVKPKIESLYKEVEWREVYNNIHGIENTDVRELNYKILYNALSCNQSYTNKDHRRKCCLCGRVEENQEHVFLKCEHTSTLLESMKSLLENKKYKLNNESMTLCYNLSKHDYQVISTYKYCIWRLRNTVMRYRVENFKALFNSYFYNLLKV